MSLLKLAPKDVCTIQDSQGLPRQLADDWLLQSQGVFNATLMIGMIPLIVWIVFYVVPYMLRL